MVVWWWWWCGGGVVVVEGIVYICMLHVYSGCVLGDGAGEDFANCRNGCYGR